MPTATLLIRQHKTLRDKFRRAKNLALLAGSYCVSLLKDSQPQTVQLGPEQVVDVPTGWGNNLKLESLRDYLHKYRQDPQNCRPDPAVQAVLHHFLFGESVLDGPFQAISSQVSEIFISSDSSSVLTNVPWELAGVGPTVVALDENKAKAWCFDTSMAALPLARIWPAQLSYELGQRQERLRVVYCISEPPTNTRFGADNFLAVIDRILLERSGMLERVGVVGSHFSPRFDEVEASLNGDLPAHIVIIACHGETKDGEAKLLFDQWIPVGRLVEALRHGRSTFLIVLIACDQVVLEETPAAESGALSLVKGGLPAAIAMQSSVRSDLAAEFLGGLLDGLFHSSIASAVSQGRRKMAPNRTACEHVEWSFPALFLNPNAIEQAKSLTERLQGYVPALESMMRSIPLTPAYLPRGNTDAMIGKWLGGAPNPGLHALDGPGFVGKTTTIRHACRSAISSAIGAGNAQMRPILYLDMDGRATPEDSDVLASLLRNRIADTTPVIGPRLFPVVPPARGPDGAKINFGLTQVMALIDSGIVLVIDNFDEKASVWKEFLESSKSLVHSTVLAVVADAAPLNLAADATTHLATLDRKETSRFLELRHPGQASRSEEMFRQSGGIPALLDLIASQGTDNIPSGDRDPDIELLERTRVLVERLNQEDRNVLCQMVHLPNGVSHELASQFLPDWNYANVGGLVSRGLLTTEYRHETRWFRLAGLVRSGLLRTISQDADQARDVLAENFREQISGDDEEVVENVRQLLARTGGREFFRDMHSLCADMGAIDDLRALPLLANEWLFSHGYWNDAYRLWLRVVQTVRPEDTLADDWIMLGNASHKLGRPAEACRALKNARRHSPDKFEMIRMQLLYAAVLKDLGAIKHSTRVSSLYDSALQSLDAELNAAADPDKYWLASQKAIATYNRALHRRYWLRDTQGAMSDLENASEQFKSIANTQMMAMADCEWAEIQLTVVHGEKDWTRILQRLVRADKDLERAEIPSDRAFCNYQLARYYRRAPADDAPKKRAHLEAALQAYSISSAQAVIADDLRQQQIAQAGIVELSRFRLQIMTDEEAAEQLEKIAQLLRAFREDTWSARVLRDVLVMRSELNSATAYLKQGLDVATTNPLTPDRGTDAYRAAWILHKYLSELAAAGNILERNKVAILYDDLLKTWLGDHIDPARPEMWVDQLRGFGHRPGEYDG